MYSVSLLSVLTQSKDVKGLKNKKEYLGEKVNNTLSTGAKGVLVSGLGIAASIGAAKAAKDSSRAQMIFEKITGSLRIGSLNLQDRNKYIAKGVNAFKSLPGHAKAAAAATMLLTLGLVNRVCQKGIYKSGRITQEYIDKSKLD